MQYVVHTGCMCNSRGKHVDRRCNTWLCLLQPVHIQTAHLTSDSIDCYQHRHQRFCLCTYGLRRSLFPKIWRRTSPLVGCYEAGKLNLYRYEYHLTTITSITYFTSIVHPMGESRTVSRNFWTFVCVKFLFKKTIFRNLLKICGRLVQRCPF